MAETPPSVQEPDIPEKIRLPDPASGFCIVVLGIYFCLIAALASYALVATWPVPAPPPPTGQGGYEDFYFFGSSFKPKPDLRLFITVICAGAVGSLIHSITSFADYVGNRKLGRSWIWWLVLRVPIGVALALLFYLILRGGLLVPTLPSTNGGTDASHLLNPYGFASIGALAGLFSKQATDKLREVFDTLFRTTEPVSRADPLDHAIPVITAVDPPKLKVGTPAVLTVTGRVFQNNCQALIGGDHRISERVSDTLLKVTTTADDVANSGTLELIIRNPGPTGGDSALFVIEVSS